jgi:SAM-dependent methyltransferase
MARSSYRVAGSALSVGITVLTGPPGSGKSRYLIDLLATAESEGVKVLTFFCSDFPWEHKRRGHLAKGIFGSRDPTSRWRVDHFVSNGEFAELLERVPAGALVAIDEAYAFAPNVARNWLQAASRGVDVIAAAPSKYQMALLAGQNIVVKHFSMKCERCSVRDVETTVLRPDTNRTLSLCGPCLEDFRADALKQLRDRFQAGDDAVAAAVSYQPVDVPELDWSFTRRDTPRRAELMLETASRTLSVTNTSSRPTFLDIGCGTGYFCHSFAKSGYSAHGIDVDSSVIEVARLLESLGRRTARGGGPFVSYDVADGYKYVQATRDQSFDVTAALSVLDSIVVQHGLNASRKFLSSLAKKTRHVMFVDVDLADGTGSVAAASGGQSAVAMVADAGDFHSIELYERARYGLERDLVAAIKS